MNFTYNHNGLCTNQISSYTTFNVYTRDGLEGILQNALFRVLAFLVYPIPCICRTKQ